MTDCKQRKHRTQMTDAELAIIRHRLTELTLVATPHLLERCQEWSIRSLPRPESCAIVEYNQLNEDWRVLLRSHLGFCYVVSLQTGRIVTAYMNAADDNHASLDMSEYNQTLTVLV